jgi:hypothetical protein
VYQRRSWSFLRFENCILTPVFQIAQGHAWRGEKDQAFAWLDRAYTLHDAGMVRLPYDPGLDPLREDPRFAALVQKRGFPK